MQLRNNGSFHNASESLEGVRAVSPYPAHPKLDLGSLD